jgi:bacteriocin-like protein
MSTNANTSGMSEICELTDDELISVTGGQYVINVANLMSQFLTDGWLGSSQLGGGWHGSSQTSGWHGSH